MASASELKAQIEEVDGDLENLRRTVAEVRSNVGEEEDPEDRGALIQQADELDGQVQDLLARRADLVRQLEG